MNKPAKKIVTASTLLLTGMYAFNQYIDTNISPDLPSVENQSFTWQENEIIYTEKGESNRPPILLIHNLYPSASKDEWYRIDDTLAKQFHVYALDLPGCGRSDKPNETYVNYMFVQLLSKFITEVIGTKTSICASACSSSFAIMTTRLYPDIVDKLIVINPTSIDDLVKPVTKKSELLKLVLELPIIGTFLYNCKMCKSSITDDYKYIYYYNDKNVLEDEIDMAYYNAHYKKSNGKYLYGSIIGNYTNINILHALPKIQNEIYFIANGKYKSVIQKYKTYNQNIHALYVSNCRLLPQLEIPETIVEKIDTIFHL